jgi:hypothetical protein
MVVRGDWGRREDLQAHELPRIVVIGWTFIHGGFQRHHDLWLSGQPLGADNEVPFQPPMEAFILQIRVGTPLLSHPM